MENGERLSDGESELVREREVSRKGKERARGSKSIIDVLQIAHIENKINAC